MIEMENFDHARAFALLHKFKGREQMGLLDLQLNLRPAAHVIQYFEHPHASTDQEMLSSVRLILDRKEWVVGKLDLVISVTCLK